ncbi:N-acetyltransferase [Nostoc sp. FACHB-280]|uniref:GNAT family N-acetyltransferase n=1 Tax=Nostoc sp. FACHB-280 TaxID=2692839 RepID=UPI00168BCA73|nr:GNAT family N-acetyltransferase [Nostoc sp. FACHB-280]MBD2493720.1 GNAT family N-acetyltransferase [Nostoc sp. FACHB-280]
MSEQLLPGYLIRRGSTLERSLLVKFMQRTYQERFPQQDFAHLARTVEQYLSQDTPLWWVDVELGVQGDKGIGKVERNEQATNYNSPSSPLSPLSPSSPIACLWVGNAIDQVSGDRHAHIFLLYVVPEHRRKGIGKALMQYLEKWAIQRGDKQIGLQVFESNQPALNLYNQLGYQTQSLWMLKELSGYFVGDSHE